jgi:hypothetical protein
MPSVERKPTPTLVRHQNEELVGIQYRLEVQYELTGNRAGISSRPAVGVKWPMTSKTSGFDENESVAGDLLGSDRNSSIFAGKTDETS